MRLIQKERNRVSGDLLREKAHDLEQLLTSPSSIHLLQALDPDHKTPLSLGLQNCQLRLHKPWYPSPDSCLLRNNRLSDPIEPAKLSYRCDTRPGCKSTSNAERAPVSSPDRRHLGPESPRCPEDNPKSFFHSRDLVKLPPCLSTEASVSLPHQAMEA